MRHRSTPSRRTRVPLSGGKTMGRSMSRPVLRRRRVPGGKPPVWGEMKGGDVLKRSRKGMPRSQSSLLLRSGMRMPSAGDDETMYVALHVSRLHLPPLKRYSRVPCQPAPEV
jgi:hypothetical protein